MITMKITYDHKESEFIVLPLVSLQFLTHQSAILFAYLNFKSNHDHFKFRHKEEVYRALQYTPYQLRKALNELEEKRLISIQKTKRWILEGYIVENFKIKRKKAPKTPQEAVNTVQDNQDALNDDYEANNSNYEALNHQQSKSSRKSMASMNPMPSIKSMQEATQEATQNLTNSMNSKKPPNSSTSNPISNKSKINNFQVKTLDEYYQAYAILVALHEKAPPEEKPKIQEEIAQLNSIIEKLLRQRGKR